VEEQIQNEGLSARAVHSCMKLARTIADMNKSFNISIDYLQEAVALRKSKEGSGILF